MEKQLYKYPYNGRAKDEDKIFFSDRVCLQVGKLNYKTGQILGTIAIFFSIWLAIPSRSDARFSYPAHDINRPAKQRMYKPNYFQPTYLEPNKIQLVQPKILPLYHYMTDKKARKTSKQIAQDLRGGNLFGSAVILLVIAIVCHYLNIGIEAFHVANPQAGIHLPAPPANGGIQWQRNQPRNTRSLHVLSEMAQQNEFWNHKNQVETFVKNGKLNLRSCYDEVFRRASELECDNFHCTFERFKALATENGLTTPGKAREAITILEGEMLGLYRNAAREDYGEGVLGIDFRVEGLGEFSHVTHVEVKNPVGSDIEKTSCGFSDLVAQGNKIGKRLSRQQSNWANPAFRDTIANLDQNAFYPKTPANTLGLVDQYDVPISEKIIVQNSIESQCTNLSNVVFINNDK